MFKPELTLLIDIGVVVFGTKAMFFAPFEKVPRIPGPLKKKPNTSLKDVPTNSGYSSEAKTYSNLISGP